MGEVEVEVEVEVEPWEEALDLDDSDILSTFSLRPCTNRPQTQTQPQPLHSSPPPLSSSSRARIPGPAGPIQSAMHRKQNHAEEDVISTQEYIRRVDQDSDLEFSRNPWLFARDFVADDGIGDPTPLKEIKKCGNSKRFDKVVAIVKSCNPNGIGDMMITLKDPTDTIGASVHRKVLTAGDFGKFIAVGSVLILQKVVAFHASCASCYLNITGRNVAKVITVDCEVQGFPELNVLMTPEISEENLSLECRSERIPRDVPHYNMKGKAKLMGKENSIQAPNVNVDCSKPTENAMNKTSKDHIHIDLSDSGSKYLGYIDNSQDHDDCRKATQPSLASTEVMSRKLEGIDNTKKQRWQLRVFSSAPCVTENLENRYAHEQKVAQTSRPLRSNNFILSMSEKLDNRVPSSSVTNLSMAENPVGIANFGIRTDVVTDIQDKEICCTPSVVDNQASENISKINNPEKQTHTQSTNTVFDSSMDAKVDETEDKDANVVKKQRLALISRTSVQEWTDEQLDILDMDED